MIDKKLLLKSILYRVSSTVIMSVVVFFLTGDPTLTLKYSVADFTIKTLYYYFFEVVWKKIKNEMRTRRYGKNPDGNEPDQYW